MGRQPAYTALEPAKERTQFAFDLRLRMSYEGFDALYWLGDGGVFARALYW